VSETPAVMYLEADDEITTVVRRVREADAERVVVVVPGRSRATSSAVALRLLARGGDESGREVVVVGDALTRSLAVEAGLAAYATLGDARDATAPAIDDRTEVRHAAIHVVRGTDETVVTPSVAVEEVTRPVPVARSSAAPRRSRRRPLVAGVAAIIGLLAVLGLAGAAVLPSATVTIEPATETVGPVPLVIELEDPERLNGTAAASATVTATGEYQRLRPATGDVVLFNWTFFNQEVPAGTFVAAGEQAFATQANVVVPRGQLTSDGRIRAGEVGVAVEAAAPGPAANVPARAIDAIVDRSVDARLRGFPENPERTVENPEATSGGIDQSGTEITRRDVDAAVEALTADLRQQVADEIEQHADAIVVQPELAEPEIAGLDDLAGTRDQPEATISGTLPWEAFTADRDAVTDLARGQVAEDPSPVPEGHGLIPESIEIRIEQASVDDGVMRVEVSATGRTTAQVDSGTVVQRIAGLTADEAEAELAEIGQATVELWPDWVPSVPTMEWRIDVRVVEP
jgi:hypothetical protein